MKHLQVAGGIILYDNKILCAKRGEGKYSYISFKYEFPGGKIEPGETPKEALARELKEEMDIETRIEKLKFFHTVNHRYRDFEITMQTFVCKVQSRDVKLKEHIEARWMKIDEISNLDWAEADIPIVEELVKRGVKCL